MAGDAAPRRVSTLEVCAGSNAGPVLNAGRKVAQQLIRSVQKL
jgi:hypothetical protein